MISSIHCLPTAPAQQQQKQHRSGSVASQLSFKLQQICLGAVCPQSATTASQAQSVDGRDSTAASRILSSKMEANQNVIPLSEWPKSVAGDLCWSGAAGAATSAVAHVLELQPADINEIESTLDVFKGKELHGDQVNRLTFPLSQGLADRLEEAATAVHKKQGFCVVRGLKPADYSAEDNALIFLGVASYMGNVRGVQDSNGSMFSHITVSKQWEAVPDKLRHGVHTNHGMPFHTDMGTDVLALQYRQCAAEGGRTHLASAWTLYNDLAANHPDVLKMLATPNWPIQITKARSRYMMAPLIQYHDGKIMVSLDPGRLGRQTANKEHVSNKPKTVTREGRPHRVVPELTQEQIAALETLNQLAHKHKISVESQQGDMLFVNNWGLVHARDSYTDSAETPATSRRHLVRLWLHNEDLAWKVPATLATPWVAAFGYHFKEAMGPDPSMAHPRTRVNRKYPIEPAVDYHIPKYTAGSAAFVLESSSDEESGDEFEKNDDDDAAVDGDFLVGADQHDL